jgi:hypothetical protein
MTRDTPHVAGGLQRQYKKKGGSAALFLAISTGHGSPVTGHCSRLSS